MSLSPIAHRGTAILSPSPSLPAETPALPWRVWAFGAVLALECAGLSALPHTFWMPSRSFTAAAIVFCAALAFFGRGALRNLKLNLDDHTDARHFLQAYGHRPAPPVSMRFAAAHALALGLVLATNGLLLGSVPANSTAQHALIWFWAVGILVLPLSLAGTLASPSRLVSAVRSLGSAWAWGALCAIAAGFARPFLLTAWDQPDWRLAQWLQVETFHDTGRLLRLIYPSVLSDPASFLLGTQHFQVVIAGYCSGIEGLALMLVLTLCWLVYARKELRLERAWVLVPASMLTIWMLNLARIAALIAIGDSGHAEIALGGFHSEAGWLLFNAVAVGFLFAVERMPWFRKADAAIDTPQIVVRTRVDDRGRLAAAPRSDTNAAAVYLLPMLAMLACSLISRAASDGGAFDALYPLRLVVVAGVLWAYRREYRAVNWKFGWLGPATGTAVFGIWILAQHWTGHGDGGAAISEGLASLPHWQRIVWLAVRSTAAVAVVPIAEELAFRGYVARRLMSFDVEHVSLRRLGIVAVAGSSLLFGLMHGKMWVAGTLAGVAFALVAKKRNRLGEAVAAHATANLLIAVWVLARSDYSLW